MTLRRANIALLAIGAGMTLIFFKGAHDQNTQRLTTFTAGALAASVPFLAAAWVAWHAPPARSTLLIVLGFALLFRIGPLGSNVYLSTDPYRYVWDGRVQAHGINPYRYVPAAPELASLRDREIYEHINRKTYAKTVYPPGSQVVFLLLTRVSETITGVRVTMVLCEALAAWCLVRLLREHGWPANRVLLYAWQPLCVWEFAGGAHCDAIMIAAVALALLMHRRGRPAATGAALGFAVLAKLFPVVLFPALWRRWRWDWKMPLALAATVGAGYLPYTLTYSLPGALGFLPMYTREEGLQSGDRYYFLNMLPLGTLNALHLPPAKVFMGVAGVMFALTAAWAYWMPAADERSTYRRCACVAAMFVGTLSPAVDWYYAWLAVFLPLVPEAWLLWITSSAFVLYFNWNHFAPEDVYIQNSIIFLPALVLWAVPAARRRIGICPEPCSTE